MIDWHCHLLPGVDDGSKNFDESLAMGQLLIEAGFTDIYCTPHCLYGSYDNTPSLVEKATADLQQLFCKENVPLRLHPGMEYYLDEMFFQNLENLQPLGNTRLVLVEAPQQPRPDIIKDALFQLRRRKWVPVVAHPERCFLFDQTSLGSKSTIASWLGKIWPFHKSSSQHGIVDTESLLELIANMGCQFQGNIFSFSGFYGPQVMQQAHAHLKTGLYDYFGTDGHDVRSLKKNLSQGLGKLAQANDQFKKITTSCKL